MLLLGGFRALIDELHDQLAAAGHPDVRPAHGFVFQAIGPDGTSATELGRRLGVSKQAAGKTVETLEGLGYVRRGPDPQDGRRKLVLLTERGIDVLHRSSAVFTQQRQRWATELGEQRLAELEHDLRAIAGDGAIRLDLPGSFGV